MRWLSIRIITLYQIIISPLIRSLFGIQNVCRYTVPCSEYAKRSIQKYGLIQGAILAIKRLLSCQPFGRIQE